MAQLTLTFKTSFLLPKTNTILPKPNLFPSSTFISQRFIFSNKKAQTPFNFASPKPTFHHEVSNNLLCFKRFLEIDGGEVSKGDYIVRKGKRCLVMATAKVRTGGRGASYNSIEIKEVDTGKRYTERLRVAETVTKLVTRSIKGSVTEVIRQEGSKETDMKGTCRVVATVNGEEIVFPLSKLPLPAGYYTREGDSMTVQLLINDEDEDEVDVGDDEDAEDEADDLTLAEKIINITTPHSASVVIKSLDNGAIILENGRVIRGTFPDHIKAGDSINICRDDETYLSKVVA